MSVINKVWFENSKIFIKTDTGEVLNNPLEWFPRLLNATEIERNSFKISPFGIHWDKIDEDLSLEGFYNYKPEIERHLA
jgi:Protein of unknown function (DUF2442)